MLIFWQDFFTKATTFPDWITDDDLEVKLVRKMRNKKIGIESFFFKASLDTFGEHIFGKKAWSTK